MLSRGIALTLLFVTTSLLGDFLILDRDFSLPEKKKEQEPSTVAQEDLEQIQKLALSYFGEPVDPKRVFPLKGGIQSSVFLVEHAKEHVVFRFCPKTQTTAQFFRECYVTELMAEKSIGPKVYSTSLEQHAHVLEYIPSCRGSALKEKIQQDAEGVLLDKLCKKIRQTHMSVGMQPFAFIDATVEQLDQMEGVYPKALLCAQETVHLIESVFQEKVPPALCHNDFHLGNVLCQTSFCEPANNKIFLIDWTSADFGDPYFDLAKVTYQLKEQEKERVLTSYLDRTPFAEERAHFFVSGALLDMVIAVNQLLIYNSGKQNDTVDPKVTCRSIEEDLCRIDLNGFDLDGFEGLERSYWNALFALRRFLAKEQKIFEHLELLMGRCV